MTSMPPWPFFGRIQELSSLHQHLHAGRWQTVVLHGPRRGGKTRLLREIAATDPGLSWRIIPLPDGGPGPLLAAIARTMRAYGLTGPPPQGLVEAAECLLAWSTGGVLVVLDGMQHLARPALKPFLVNLRTSVRRMQNTPPRRGGLIFVGVHGTDLDHVIHRGHAPLAIGALDLPVGPLPMPAFQDLCRRIGPVTEDGVRDLHQVLGGLPSRWRIAWNAGAIGCTREESLRRLIHQAGDELRNEALVSFGEALSGRMGEIVHLLAEHPGSTYADIVDRLVPGRARTREQPSSYLQTLEYTYRLIDRQLPDGAPATSRHGRYVVNDPFLAAWSRSIQPEVGLGA